MERHALRNISLDALKVFEVAARNGSFTLAADELNVTQVAVSKRISGLEDQLGYALFRRQGRRIDLTTRGRRLATRVNAALHYLETELEALSPGSEAGQVSISAAASISQLWLPRKLHRLTETFPDLKLVLNTTDHIRDLEASPDELSILYLPTAEHPAWTLTPLFCEELTPVAAPQYLQAMGISQTDLPLAPATLAALDCLDYRRANAHWFTLRMWFALQPSVGGGVNMKLTFSSYSMTIDAVLDGRGIALGSRNMVSDLIASGRLIELSDQVHATGNSYHLGLARHRPVPKAALSVYSELSRKDAL